MRVEVPVRACDVGGWTDTWFAEHGRVCNLAVGPGVSVVASSSPGHGAVHVELPDFQASFRLGSEPPAHRLVAEAIREAGVPAGTDVVLRVRSAVPPGTSLGTSASVCVGIIAALDALEGPVRAPSELAAAAHRVETQRLGRQSGVQDQIAAATGGACDVRIVGYPEVDVRSVPLDPLLARELDERLAHVAYGGPHDSSAVHESVIADLRRVGPAEPRLAALRELAGAAVDALTAGDLESYGRVLTAATEVQARLHPDLVSPAARQLIDAARATGALGWKVNGAGGPGGSLSVLCDGPAARDRLREAAAGLGHVPLDLSLTPQGAHVVVDGGSGQGR